jgi:hypothetical protein
MRPFRLQRSWELPLTEISALAVRPAERGEARELLVVSDEQFAIAMATLNVDGPLGHDNFVVDFSRGPKRCSQNSSPRPTERGPRWAFNLECYDGASSDTGRRNQEV